MKNLLLFALYLCACSGEQPAAKDAPPADIAPAAPTRRADSPTPANWSPQEKERIRQFWTLYRQATQLRVEGDWQSALPIFRQALALQPKHEDGLYYMGNALFETGHYAEAITHWQQLLSVNPRSTRAHLRLGALYSSHLQGAPFDLELAEREVRAALAINKEESGTVLKLGEVLLLKGDIAGAQTQFAAATRTNGHSATAHYLLAYTLFQEGEIQESLALLRKAAALNSGAPRSHSASNEGDTRSGKGPILAAGAGRGDAFATRVASLKPEAVADEDAARREFGELAVILDRFGR